MGLDVPDYMRQVGQRWFDAGFDVLALDATTSLQRGSYINGQLLDDVHLFGLWGRTVCDLSQHALAEQGHRTVWLDGLSNGGIIANNTAVACDVRFKGVVVHDILDDWRTIAKKDPSLHPAQNYSLYYLRPLLADTSHLDVMLHSRSPIFYTRSEAMFDKLVPTRHDAYTSRDGMDGVSQVKLLYKRLPHHVAEYELVSDVFAGRTAALWGRSIAPVR